MISVSMRYRLVLYLMVISHKDHCKAVKDVLKAGIDCYMSEGTRQEIGINHHRMWVVKAKTQFRIGSWTILPFDTEHDCNNPIGFLLANQAGDKLLFVTDTYYIKYNFNGLTHIMVECNFAEDILRQNVIDGLVPNDLKNRLLRSHMSLETCKDFLRLTDLSRVREIHLIHMSEGNSDALRFKKEIQALTGKPTYIA